MSKPHQPNYETDEIPNDWPYYEPGMTFEQWHTVLYELGRKHGRKESVEMARASVLGQAGEAFQKGHDDTARQLRNVAKHIGSLE